MTTFASTDIAVVAAECRFPGINTMAELHQQLCSGTPVTHSVPDTGQSDFVPVGTTMDNIEFFDPAPFGMSKREAELLEPQARLLHELCLQALDSAGHGFGRGIEQAGVIMGGTHAAFLHDRFPDFDPVGIHDPIETMEASLGSYTDYLATGIAHRLSLTGPAFTVQTACSTSLVAIHLGVQQLLLGESDLVLAGGATIHVPQGHGYQHIPDGPFSADGFTRPYSAQSSGAVFTQGAGVVALRRARDAEADGDPILAVIRGTAVNNDGGRSAGLVAPSMHAHAEVIKEAHAMADISPRQVTYVEGHGTGTRVGDPLEFAAFAEVFGSASTPWCTLGSAKAILGHTEAAAGVASMIAVIGSLQAREIPGTIGTGEPSPDLVLEGSALRLADRTQPWGTPDEELIAGISSLGFGGTNCHVVVAQAPQRVEKTPQRPQSFTVLPISAATSGAANAMTTELSQWAHSNPERLADAAWTLQHGRHTMAYKSAIVVDPHGTTVDSFEACHSPHTARVLFAFPGGGAQKTGMLEQIVRVSPRWRAEFESIARAFNTHLDGDIRAVCAPQFYGCSPVDAADPILGLPALIAAEILCAQMLTAAGITPHGVIGHSTGEYAAAIAAGALTIDQLAPLIAARSTELARMRSGAMVRVRASAAELEQVLEQFPSVEISAWNSPRSTVLAGDTDTMNAVVAQLGSSAELVPVTVAAHSTFVEPALPAVRAAAQQLQAHTPIAPVFSAATASRVTTAQLADPEFWAQHMRQPVRFHDALTTAVDELGGPVVVINVGPGATLASLTRESGLEGISATVTTAGDDRLLSEQSIAGAVAQLYTSGVPLEVAQGAITELPPYQFDRLHLWPEKAERTPSAQPSLWYRLHSRRIPRRSAQSSAAEYQLVRHAINADPHDHAAAVADCCAVLVAHARTAQRHDVVVLECTDSTTTGIVAAAARSCCDELGIRAVATSGDVSDHDVVYALAHGAAVITHNGTTSTYEVSLRTEQPRASKGTLPSTVVILGGRGRIGQVLAHACQEAGIEVVIGTRREGIGHVDPSDPQDLARLLREHGCGCSTAVIVATGVVGEQAFAEASDTDAACVRHHWQAKPQVVAAVREACELLGDAAPGHVVVMSSLAAYTGGVGLAAYAAANRAAECVVAPGTDTRWSVVASDGWRSGEQNSFGRKLLRQSLSQDQGVAAVMSVLASALDGIALLTTRDTDGASFVGSDTAEGAQEHASVQAVVSSGSVAEDVKQMWSQSLGVDVDDSADFFDLGGSSLQATKLLADVRDRFGVDIRLRHLLAQPSISAMVERIHSQRGEVPEAPVAPETPATSVDTWPLTPVQRAYMTGRTHSFGLNAAACHSFVETLVPEIESFDSEALNRAVSTVIDRHPMLRAVVDVEGHHALIPSAYRVPVTDCRRSANPEQALQRWREKYSTRESAADQWPLVSLAVAYAPDGVHVGWSVDVLVCDASSFGILFDEISTAYRGQALPPAPQRHFAEHVAAVHTSAKDREFWESQLSTLPPAPALGEPAGENESFHRLTYALDAVQAERLEQAAKEHKTTVTSLFLWAYAKALSDYTGQGDMSLMLTVFDRAEEFAGVIGDFTSLVPCPIRWKDGGDSIAAVSTSLFDALDHSSMPGPDIVARKSAQDATAFRLPVVFTSTIGTQVDGGAHDGLGTMIGGASQTPQVVLDHQVFQWGGTLHAQFDAVESVLDAEALERFLAIYRRYLDEIAPLPQPSSAQLGSADVIAVWKQILGVSEVCAQSQWAQCGGDSLDAIRVVAALRRIGVHTSVEEILGGITPDELGSKRTEVDVVTVRRHPTGEPFVLTPLQQAYLVGADGGWDFSHHSAHFYVDYADPDATGEQMIHAVRALIRHQPMLRAIVTDDGHQRILDADDPQVATPPVEVLDLCDATADEVDRAINEVRESWSVAPVDPRSWPTFRILVHELPEGGSRIHVQASLLFVDGWSFYLFFDQLFTFLDNPNTVLPRASLSFADYVVTVAELDAQQREDDTQWWCQRLADLPQPAALPIARPDSYDGIVGMHRDAGRLTTQRAQEFFRICQEHNTTPTAVIGAAWAQAVCALSGDEELLMAVLYFNRKAIAEDVDRVLGPFATTALVHCTPQHWGTDQPAGFAGALATSLSHASVSGIEVARMVSRHRSNHDVVAPVVFTSTLGFDDQASAAATARVDETDVFERVVTPQVLLDLQASMENGSVAINLDSPRGAFNPEATAALLDHVLCQVNAYIDNAGHFEPETTATAALHQWAQPRDDHAVAVHDDRTAQRSLARCCSPESLAAVTSEFSHVLGQDCAAETNMYDAGGDSLSMVRIIARLRANQRLEITPEAFLSDPTPAGVAARAAYELDPDIHVLPLADGTGEPLYLLHPSGGDVLCYMGLARELQGRPVYAVADPGLEDTPMPVDLDAVALTYGRVIMAHRAGLAATGTHGVHETTTGYLIGGWSMGGTVAQRVAVQWRDQGIAVGALVLIDSNSPDRIRALTGMNDREVDAEFARRYLRSLQAFGANTVDASAVTESDPASGVARALAGQGLALKDVERRISVFTRHLAGLAQLRARPLVDVPTLLVIAEHQSPANSGVGMGVDDARDTEHLGWGDNLPTSTTEIVVPGHHYSVLSAPGLEIISEQIRELLA